MMVKLNMGCGSQKMAGYVGLDIRRDIGVNIICDLNKSIPIKSDTVDHIYTKSFLEHIDHFELLMKDFYRVLKPYGTVYIYVPHWTNPFYYSDYTHRRLFGLRTFDYFSPKGQYRFNKLPHYSEIYFLTKEVRLLFFSPFPLLRFFMKAFQLIVNSNKSFQVLYEFHLSSVVPCYAIEYQLIAYDSKHTLD